MKNFRAGARRTNFNDEDEAVASPTTRSTVWPAGIFTQDGAKAHRVVRRLRAGVTWINTYAWTYNEAPWGGYKQSGIGRELGTEGYDAYTEIKQVNVNLEVRPTNWFPAAKPGS